MRKFKLRCYLMFTCLLSLSACKKANEDVKAENTLSASEVAAKVSNWLESQKLATDGEETKGSVS